MKTTILIQKVKFGIKFVCINYMNNLNEPEIKNENINT